jgi:hypothetical protein
VKISVHKMTKKIRSIIVESDIYIYLCVLKMVNLYAKSSLARLQLASRRLF